MKISSVRLNLTEEVEQYLTDTAKLHASGSVKSNVAVYWFSTNNYMIFNARATRSSKAQPLVTLKQLHILQLLPTPESRYEWCKANIKRKWD